MRTAVIISICFLAAVSVRADDDVESFADLYTPDGWTLRAGATHERRKTGDSRQRLLAAHEHDPSDDAATVRLAVFEARTGNDKRALELLATVGAVSSFRALALYDVGLIRLARGELATARTTFADAALVSSGHAEPSIALGITCLRTGDKRSAASAFAEAEKNAKGALASSCALRAARLEEGLGELEAAAAAYERASAWADQGRVLLRLGRAADASVAYEKALVTKDDPEVRFHYGLALLLAGKPVDKEIDALAKTKPDLSRRLAEIAAKKTQGGH